MNWDRNKKHLFYSDCFDEFEKKLIYRRNLLVSIILKEAGTECIYPFESLKDLFQFMTSSVSKPTMDFVMIYLLLDIYGLEIFDLEIGRDITEINNYREYLAYWLIDCSYAETKNKEALDKYLAKCIEWINHPDSDNDIEYIGFILQSLHELKAVQYSKVLGSEFQIFLKQKYHADNTGYIQDLSFHKENDLTVFIYTLWKFKNYNQAYLVLNESQNDLSFNSAFIIFAYSMLKDHKLLELLNFSFNHKQRNLLTKLFKNEELVSKFYHNILQSTECFITPYLNSKDRVKIIKSQQMISNELFFDETNEQKYYFDMLNKLVLNFTTKCKLSTNSSKSLGSECNPLN